MSVLDDIGEATGLSSPDEPDISADPPKRLYYSYGTEGVSSVHTAGSDQRAENLDTMGWLAAGRAAPTATAAQADPNAALGNQWMAGASTLRGQDITSGGVAANMLGTAQNKQGAQYLGQAAQTLGQANQQVGAAGGYLQQAAQGTQAANQYLGQGTSALGQSGQTLGQAAAGAQQGNQFLAGIYGNVGQSQGLIQSGAGVAPNVQNQIGETNAFLNAGAGAINAARDYNYDAARTQGLGTAALGQSGQLIGDAARYAGYGMSDVEAARAAASGQQQFINQLGDAAFGTGGPSAAELAMSAQADRQAAQNLAMAQSVGGPGGNAARLAAVNQNAVQQGQLVRDLGVQRAQEQLSQRELLGQSLAQMRGQSIDTAGAVGALGGLGVQAGGAMGQNAATAGQLSQAQIANAQSLADQGSALGQLGGLSTQAAQAQLGLGGLYGNLAGQATTNAQAMAAGAGANTAQMQALTGIGGQQAQNAAIYGQLGGLSLDQANALAGIGGQAGQLAGTQAGIGAQQGALAGLNTDIASNYYRGADSLAGLAGAQDLTTQGLQRQADQQIQMEQFNAQLQQEVALGNLSAEQAQRVLNDQTYMAMTTSADDLRRWQTEQLAQAERDRINAELGVGATAANLYGSQLGASAQRFGAITGAAGAGGAALLPVISDIRAKDRIAPAAAEVSDAFRDVGGYGYEYRDPGRHGEGRFYGPMAQELERSPATAPAVVEGRDGTKAVDSGRLALTTASEVGQQRREIDQVKRDLYDVYATRGEISGGDPFTEMVAPAVSRQEWRGRVSSPASPGELRSVYDNTGELSGGDPFTEMVSPARSREEYNRRIVSDTDAKKQKAAADRQIADAYRSLAPPTWGTGQMSGERMDAIDRAARAPGLRTAMQGGVYGVNSARAPMATQIQDRNVQITPGFGQTGEAMDRREQLRREHTPVQMSTEDFGFGSESKADRVRRGLDRFNSIYGAATSGARPGFQVQQSRPRTLPAPTPMYGYG